MTSSMDEDEVNRLIMDEVDEISDSDCKQFVREIIKFERGYLDKENFEYKDYYKNLIKDYAGTEAN